MRVALKKISLSTQGWGDTLDLTPQAAQILKEENLNEGLLTLTIPGSTAAITTIEFEAGVITDLRAALERLAPQNIPYQHDRRWGDGNGFAHVRAALMKPSLSLPFAEGRLLLGTWQQIILLDFDNRPRQRDIWVQIIGQ